VNNPISFSPMAKQHLSYQITPVNASIMPSNFPMLIVSSNKSQPLSKMQQVFRWPTMLYVRGDVCAINKKVDSDTSSPKHPDNTIVHALIALSFVSIHLLKAPKPKSKIGLQHFELGLPHMPSLPVESALSGR
jgi:hypothetical protein